MIYVISALIFGALGVLAWFLWLEFKVNSWRKNGMKPKQQVTAVCRDGDIIKGTIKQVCSETVLIIPENKNLKPRWVYRNKVYPANF